MKQKPGIQIPSSSTGQLRLFRDETHISTGTAFALSTHNGKTTVVTCLHNLTGRNFFTGECLDKRNLATPNRFSLSIWLSNDGETLHAYELKGALFNNAAPLFFFDTSEQGADIAVFEVTADQFAPRVSSLGDIEQQDWSVFAGQDVFVLGYPSSLSLGQTPVWKKASIASEPSQKVDGRPLVLLDGLTFSGMSGGPVFIMQSQGFSDSGVYDIGPSMKLRILGVYGGRYSTDREKSGQLGYFWPIKKAVEIYDQKLKKGVVDTF